MADSNANSTATTPTATGPTSSLRVESNQTNQQLPDGSQTTNYWSPSPSPASSINSNAYISSAAGGMDLAREMNGSIPNSPILAPTPMILSTNSASITPASLSPPVSPPSSYPDSRLPHRLEDFHLTAGTMEYRSVLEERLDFTRDRTAAIEFGLIKAVTAGYDYLCTRLQLGSVGRVSEATVRSELYHQLRHLESHGLGLNGFNKHDRISGVSVESPLHTNGRGLVDLTFQLVRPNEQLSSAASTTARPELVHLELKTAFPETQPRDENGNFSSKSVDHDLERLALLSHAQAGKPYFLLAGDHHLIEQTISLSRYLKSRPNAIKVMPVMIMRLDASAPQPPIMDEYGDLIESDDQYLTRIGTQCLFSSTRDGFTIALYRVNGWTPEDEPSSDEEEWESVVKRQLDSQQLQHQQHQQQQPPMISSGLLQLPVHRATRSVGGVSSGGSGSRRPSFLLHTSSPNSLTTVTTALFLHDPPINQQLDG